MKLWGILHSICLIFLQKKWRNMRYIKPHFYDKFECIADKCKDTCCAGWQIVIDEDTLEKYAKVGGKFGNRLMNSIDWGEEMFYQNDRRCSFLGDDNLCDIYREMGPDYLCDTCRNYPRHVEEYDGLRELSLTLSCPTVAKMILECKDPVTFVETETMEEDDFEEFDFLLFSQLEDARDVVFHILQNREVDLRVRMKMCEHLAYEFQKCVDDGTTYQIDRLLEKYEHFDSNTVKISEKCYEKRKKEYALLVQLEKLRPEWTELLEKVERTLYGKGEEEYNKIVRNFQHQYGYESENRLQWERIGEQLMMFFVYTYFCGAVYDDWIISKMRLAVFCTTWIQELVMFAFVENDGEIGMENVIEMAYRFAREVEHSDLNLDTIEEWLQYE